MDHRTTTMAGGIKKTRNRLQGPPPKWADVRGMLHMRLKDAAAELNVPITYLRRLCHQNGFPQWPGKRIRYMNGIGMKVDARDGSPWPGLAGPSQLAKITETQKEEDDDMTPGKELITLNLIDKVGSSSNSERS